MQRNCVEPVENTETGQLAGNQIYQPRIEPDNTCSGYYAGNETDFANTVRFRAGLTARQLTKFLSRIPRHSGCCEWLGSRIKKGYGQFHAGRWPDGRQDVRYAHRVIWELHHGPIAEGLVVRHKCDNPPCCNIEHLAIGTQGDNVADAQVQGKYKTSSIARWRRDRDPLRLTVVEAAMRGPRGTLTRLCREHGLNFDSMKIAVHRARRARKVA